MKHAEDEEEQLPLTATAELDEKQTKDTSTTNKTDNNVGLIVLIVSWYACSVVCTNTSKSLHISWKTLTLCQMLISTACAWIGIRVFRLDGSTTGSPKILPDRNALPLTVLLALAFCAGFVTLNYSIEIMHVSTVMTLRAAEPVATYILSLGMFPQESTSFSQVLSLVPICVGAGLSAVAREHGNDDARTTAANNNVWGVLVVMTCNVCFSLRTLLTKRLKAQYKIDNFNLFLQLCAIGSILQSILSLLLSGGHPLQDLTSVLLTTRSSSNNNNKKAVAILIVNGITFYLYLQLSWIVMSRVGAVTHSVCNALRRPVICAFGWIVFGGATLEGMVGVVIATAGTMLYAQAKQTVK